jgi:3-oxoacid CoA-transferase A subunit
LRSGRLLWFIMIDKIVPSFDDAVADIPDGATIHIGGFVGPNYAPGYLIAALARHAPQRLTVCTTAMGLGREQARDYAESMKHLFEMPPDFVHPALLAELHLVARAITTFPASSSSREGPIEVLLRDGEVEVELIGQGSLAERIRAARAGIAAFYTPVGPGTAVADGKEIREFDGVPHVLERALKADYALIRAHQADRYGNLVYRGPSSFSGTMAGAARITIAEVDEIVPLGNLDPHAVVTPGVYVQRVVQRPAIPVTSWETPC